MFRLVGGALEVGKTGGMREMTSDERRAFLLTGTRTGKLATVRPDGRPHVAPVWFVLDGVTEKGDVVVFTTGADTVKGRPSGAIPGSPSWSRTKRRRSPT